MTKEKILSTEKKHSYQELRKLAEQFLLQHKLGILATGRKNGTAQQSLVYYNYNGTDISITASESTAKIKNIRKNSGISFAVSEGETCVVVYGEAKLLQGKSAENYLGRPLSQGLQPGERTLIILSPKTWRWARIAD
ncbi:MAG: hypothetical protein CL752_01005 [Chloroflexi bacterium]|nr:hypothetical protein [Chloroflexota bacterium]|tara:strand:- start:790 stop:1200 length:411 start_codon:yes stop_codon:yes gene_type:complete